MAPATRVWLEFERKLSLRERETLCKGLSCVAIIGDTLFAANDETTHVERLTQITRAGNRPARYARHTRFALPDFIALPERKKSAGADRYPEADLEGMAYRDGYLWLVGSHSRRRQNIDDSSHKDAHRGLSRVESTGNQYLLARVPIASDENGTVLTRTIAENQIQRRASRLRASRSGNELTELLKRDEHLARFLKIPGKENGLDVEGLAVGHEGRVFLGLRGPVLDGWAVIIELRVVDSIKKSALLELKKMPLSKTGGIERKYRKHFVDLNGLGIRDLCVAGNDLLILSGPTMAAEAVSSIFRWKNGARPSAESVMPEKRLQKVLDLPFGNGDERAEGIALLPPSKGGATRVLIVHDRASKKRRRGTYALAADIYEFPG